METTWLAVTGIADAMATEFPSAIVKVRAVPAQDTNPPMNTPLCEVTVVGPTGNA